MRRKRTIGAFFYKTRLVWAILLVAALAAFWVEHEVSSLVFSYGEHAVTTLAQERFAEAVKELCADNAVTDDTVKKDENGSVTAFSSNTVLQNALQSRLASALCDAFEDEDRCAFSVPVGTLLGDALSAGRGPSVSFYVAFSGSPTVKLADEFSSAGINQTYHTVTATAHIDLLLTAVGKQHKTTLTLSVPVSQTVIVGDVPKFYAQF